MYMNVYIHAHMYIVAATKLAPLQELLDAVRCELLLELYRIFHEDPQIIS